MKLFIKNPFRGWNRYFYNVKKIIGTVSQGIVKVEGKNTRLSLFLTALISTT